MVFRDRLSQVLQQRRLARLGRRDDQPTLTPSDRGDQIDDPEARLGLLRRELEGLVGVDGDEVLEMGKGPVLLRGAPSRLLDFNECATPTATVTGEPFDHRPVADPVVPRYG